MSVADAEETNTNGTDRSDDLIIEENEDVIKALKRLPPQESYDRVYRLRRAFQASAIHQLLPKEEWTKPEEVGFFSPSSPPNNIFPPVPAPVNWGV